MIPRRWGWLAKLVGFAALAISANIPDLPLPYWGHPFHHHVSHSLFVTLGLMAILAAVLWWWPSLRRKGGGWLFAGAFMLSWASHLLLDSFYGHSDGVRIYWPVSDAPLSLPISCFDAVPSHRLSPDPRMFRVIVIELLVYGTVLALCLAGRALAHRPRAKRTPC
jgi:membrane-bound metal-dependent hydrolase YbcI (DUF457 family)